MWQKFWGGTFLHVSSKNKLEDFFTVVWCRDPCCFVDARGEGGYRSLQLDHWPGRLWKMNLFWDMWLILPSLSLASKYGTPLSLLSILGNFVGLLMWNAVFNSFVMILLTLLFIDQFSTPGLRYTVNWGSIFISTFLISVPSDW